ncbi:MAG: BamA/TamA family outer membrane protein [Cryomorphaceae bacterium]|nr:BamA/TamA family outer membrane protein [Cryomorphaceae bacterium]
MNDTIKPELHGVTFVPLLYYTPDTRFAAGASLVYYFSIPAADSTEKPTRLSFLQMLADYTQNNQFDFWAIWNIFTRNENYLFKGELRYRNFPDRFYGIGNTTKDADMERYSFDLFSAKFLMLKKIHKDLFFGADLHLGREYNFEFEEGRALTTGDIAGARDLNEIGLGAVLVYDTRDNVINAYRGALLELSTYHYNPTYGSTYQYTNINLIGQHYRSLKHHHILAFQIRGNLNFGEVPFLDMGMAGNDDLLRGYARNRFRDHHFMGGQTEYRFPMYKRLGGVVFAGAGDVFNTLNDLNFSHLKYSLGAGLRFLVNPAERLNIRFDVGFGRNSIAYYLMVTEAF